MDDGYFPLKTVINNGHFCITKGGSYYQLLFIIDVMYCFNDGGNYFLFFLCMFM